jgi:hypothetical protein
VGPTSIATILTQVRAQLVEVTARFWTDTELTDIFKLGVMDLWGAILDLHQDHYFEVIEDGSVFQASGATQLTGVPADCFRVMLIEPLNTVVDNSATAVQYAPRKYNHPDFTAARTVGTFEPNQAGVIYFDVTGPGAPIAAPKIRVAPQLSSNLKLRFAYYPMLAVTDYNPVPGGSDNALKAWVLAYAMAKEGQSGQRIPDAGWLAIYATEKQTILTRMTPRQEQEAETVDGLFQDRW